jgi:peptide/nickel transport system substrate-binding protein
LLERGFATVDEAARERLAEQAMILAMRDYAVIPLHHQIANWAMTRDLRFPGRTDEYTLAREFTPALAPRTPAAPRTPGTPALAPR